MEEIHDYIARDKPLAAKKLIDGFKRKFETLASFPELGARSDQISPGLRSHVVGNYVVFYEQLQTGIRIIRVAAGWRG